MSSPRQRPLGPRSTPEGGRATFQTADACAEVGLAALFGGRRNVVSGWSNKLMMFSLRFVPRALMLFAAAVTMGKPKPRALGAATAPAAV